MKIFLTSSADPKVLSEKQFPELPRARYLAGANKPYTLVDSAAEADLIVYWEFYEESELFLCPKLRSEENIRKYPEKCFVVNTEDNPIPFFPGVYASLTRKNYDPFRHRTGCYGIVMNRFVTQYAAENVLDPEHLASFTGSASHPVRAALLEEPSIKSSCLLHTVPLFSFTVDVDAPAKAKGQELYARQMANSKLSLCPRGSGPGTHRVFESMEMGRCPVIVNDDWVPPEGPAWQDCSIRVAERKLKNLHDIMREHEPRWRELGRAARLEWERWFAPETFVYRTFQSIETISNIRKFEERKFRKKWGLLEARHRYEKSKVNRGIKKCRRLMANIFPQRTT